MLNTQSQAPLNQICLALLYAGPMSIGTRLRQLRKANNLSGDKFGELCGVTKGMVSQWETGDTTPPTDRLLELHKHLEFSFDWLLNGEGEDDATTYTTSDPALVEILKALEPRGDYGAAPLSKDDEQILGVADYLPPDKLGDMIKRIEEEGGSKLALLARLRAIQREGEAIEPPKPAPEPLPRRTSGKPYKLPEPGIAKPHAGHHKKRGA